MTTIELTIELESRGNRTRDLSDRSRLHEPFDKGAKPKSGTFYHPSSM